MSPRRFAAEGIVKRFGPVLALDGVSFETRRGEIHALLGENGAGKSTLVKVLVGAQQPDAGALTFDGTAVRLSGPQDAVARSVAVVHQDDNLWPDLTVAEAMLGTLPAPPRRGAFVDRVAMRRRARELLDRLGIVVDPERRIGELDPGERKFIEIGRALALDATFLILDEPTASLESREADGLLALLERLRDTDHGIILVTHRLEEVLRIADRATMLRDGRNAATLARDAMSAESLVEAILGRGAEAPPELPPCGETPVLALRGMRARAGSEPFDLDVRAGEIIGLTGLIGSGAKAVMRQLVGIRPAHGAVALRGRTLRLRDPADAVRAGIGFIPEDRKAEGLALEQSVANNIALAALHRISRLGFVDRAARHALAERFRSSLGVRCASVDAPVRTLSGGNQQKVLIARQLASGVTVIVVEEPTHGVDIGAKAEIHRQLCAFAARGGAVVFLSTEVRELLAIAHRIVVFHGGAPVAVLAHADADAERVTALSTGLAKSEAA